MRKLFLILTVVSLFAGLTVLAASPTTPAGKTAATSQTLKYEGEVTTVNATAKSFSVKEGENITEFTWNASTHVSEAHHTVTETALVAGSKVMIHYVVDDGKNVAHSIMIMPPHNAQAATHPKTATTMPASTNPPNPK